MKLFLVLINEVKAVGLNYVLVLIVERVEVLLEYIPSEQLTAGVYDDVIPVDVAKPAVLFVEVFVYGLSVLVYGDWLPPKGISFFEVILAAESV
jgi:hypothetical protein